MPYGIYKIKIIWATYKSIKLNASITYQINLAWLHFCSIFSRMSTLKYVNNCSPGYPGSQLLRSTWTDGGFFSLCCTFWTNTMRTSLIISSGDWEGQPFCFQKTQYPNKVLIVNNSKYWPTRSTSDNILFLQLTFPMMYLLLKMLLNPQSSTCRCSSSILCCGSILSLV